MKNRTLYGFKEITSYPETYDANKRQHAFHTDTRTFPIIYSNKKYAIGRLNLKKKSYILKEHATIQSETETSVTLKYHNITKKLEIVEFIAFIN